MVVGLDLHPQLLQLDHHLRAQIVEAVGGRHREVALLVPWLVAEVGAFITRGVPLPLHRVDGVEAALGGLLITNVVEDEELGLGAEVGGVSEAEGAEVALRLLCDVAGVAGVGLLGDGIDDVADHAEGRLGAEGVHPDRTGVRDDQHV